MKLTPVLDVLNRRAVWACEGRRNRYQPLKSAFSAQSDPIEIARGFRDRFGFGEIYVADLDGILRGDPDPELPSLLADLGYSPFVDAGASDADAVQATFENGAARVLLGTESWCDPDSIADAIRRFGSERVVLSIDLMDGRVRSPHPDWSNADPEAVVEAAWRAGVRTYFPLELRAVGAANGVPTLKRLPDWKANWPGEYWVGGGVRSEADLEAASAAGADAVLVATALHGGALSPAAVRRWNAPRSEV
jgi:phosphoribosylformimino-5-aminoimidazole carboxamide ribotide isomerase